MRLWINSLQYVVFCVNQLHHMETLTLQQYVSLTEKATVLAKDSFGDKVLQLKNGTIIKLFRCKHLFSSALLVPYSKRFIKNAKRLNKLGIPTVFIISLWRIPAIKRTGVYYRPLQGETARDYFSQISGEQKKHFISKLACFIENLHSNGIYFRSLHCGNIIETEGKEPGLIDIHDMKFYRKSLSVRLRLRNLLHFTRYKEDMALLSTEDKELFIKVYCQQCTAFNFPTKKISRLFF